MRVLINKRARPRQGSLRSHHWIICEAKKTNPKDRAPPASATPRKKTSVNTHWIPPRLKKQPVDTFFSTETHGNNNQHATDSA